MDFDTVADELYAGEPAEFISARNAAVKAAKADGDKALAARIGELRKPTAAAAAVNRLARSDSTSLASLAELGERLRDAHTRLAGDDLRALARERAELVRAVVRELPSLSDPVMREVEATLEAVTSDPNVGALALAGRLTSVAHQDVDQWLSMPVATAPAPAARRPPKLVEKAEPAPPRRASKAAETSSQAEEKERLAREEASQAAERARAERQRLHHVASQLEKERSVADRELTTARRVAEQFTARVDDLRTRLEEAEERAARATADFESAKAKFEELDESATSARKAADASS